MPSLLLAKNPGIPQLPVLAAPAIIHYHQGERGLKDLDLAVPSWPAWPRCSVGRRQRTQPVLRVVPAAAMGTSDDFTGPPA